VEVEACCDDLLGGGWARERAMVRDIDVISRTCKLSGRVAGRCSAIAMQDPTLNCSSGWRPASSRINLLSERLQSGNKVK
jgi:hypothetical protein